MDFENKHIEYLSFIIQSINPTVNRRIDFRDSDLISCGISLTSISSYNTIHYKNINIL